MMNESDPIDLDQFKPLRMTRAEYYAWARGQAGRFERVDGEVVAVAPERVGHVRTKTAVLAALDAAIAEAGLECEAIGDGATVPTEGRSDFEPDALVRCGPMLDDDTLVIADPVIVVEVLSDSARAVDTGHKLDGYFSVPSIRHYLIVNPRRAVVVHHRRRDDGAGIDTNLVAGGELVLNPPGLRVDVSRFHGRARSPAAESGGE